MSRSRWGVSQEHRAVGYAASGSADPPTPALAVVALSQETGSNRQVLLAVWESDMRLPADFTSSPNIARTVGNP
ncbi:MAG: hypothetical protein WBG36_15105 [Ornithinimicrobium sp.]